MSLYVYNGSNETILIKGLKIEHGKTIIKKSDKNYKAADTILVRMLSEKILHDIIENEHISVCYTGPETPDDKKDLEIWTELMN